MRSEATWRIRELLDSGYNTREVANILDIPFHVVLKIETEKELETLSTRKDSR